MPTNSTASIEEMHDAYLAICKMSLPMRQKCRMLTEVFCCSVDAWRVVGITPAALEVFSNHNFRRVSKMGINRAHLKDRAELYTQLINDPIEDVDKWWSHYHSNDRTVFATKEENSNGINEDEVIWFEPHELFKMQGFAWRHTKEEVAFLENIHEGV